MKGPPRKRSHKAHLKNAREMADAAHRLALDKYDDLQRMKDGKEKDGRNKELMKSGKEMHFLEPAGGEPRAPSKEITQAQIDKAVKVPILTRPQIMEFYKHENGCNITPKEKGETVITTYTQLYDWAQKTSYIDKLVIVADGLVWLARYDKDGNPVENYQLTFENVGLRVWVPQSPKIIVVRIAQVFDKLKHKFRQAVISYVCCMANLEVEAMNDLLDKDDPNYKKEWKL